MVTSLLPKSLNHQIYRWFWKTVDFVYPPSCAGCGKPGEILCTECRETVHKISENCCQICGYPIQNNKICQECQTNPPAYNSLRSWAEFGGPLRKALHKLKYESDLELGYTFSLPLIEIIQNNQWDLDLIIPMPISKEHKKTRGYNQSTVLARPIAIALKKPLVQDVLFRIKETKTQVNLSRDERFKNLQSAFLGNSATLKDKKVLLVDDIVTTGATMISCAQSLKEAGCNKIYCLSVARTMKYVQ